MMRRALISRFAPPAAAALMAAVLAGCSGGDAVPSLELQVIDTARTAVAAKTAARAAGQDGQGASQPVTRELLEELGGSYLEVTLERHDQRAYLHVDATRRDETPGRITVWRTDDNITLTMRSGVLVGTRGMGGDIASGSVQVAPDAPGPAGGGARVYRIHGLDNQLVTLALACDVADLGSQTIDIIDRKNNTRHLRETCTGGVSPGGETGTVVNDYWIDRRLGLVLQSRQWAGPNVGYLRMRRITY